MKRFYLFCNSSLTVGIVWSQSQLHSQVGVLSTKLSSKLQGILVPVWLEITKLPNFSPVMATKSRIKNVPQNVSSHKNYGYGTTAASISIPQYNINIKNILSSFNGISFSACRKVPLLPTNQPGREPTRLLSIGETKISGIFHFKLPSS